MCIQYRGIVELVDDECNEGCVDPLASPDNLRFDSILTLQVLKVILLFALWRRTGDKCKYQPKPRPIVDIHAKDGQQHHTCHEYVPGTRGLASWWAADTRNISRSGRSPLHTVPTPRSVRSPRLCLHVRMTPRIQLHYAQDGDHVHVGCVCAWAIRDWEPNATTPYRIESSADSDTHDTRPTLFPP
ncbi:unnamed protein product [Sphagnum balticum]